VRAAESSIVVVEPSVATPAVPDVAKEEPAAEDMLEPMVHREVRRAVLWDAAAALPRTRGVLEHGVLEVWGMHAGWAVESGYVMGG
jgi:hypothetical protein